MPEKIRGYNNELASIEEVVKKLITKQNSTVFDKICDMINKLFNRMTAYNPNELTKDDIQNFIAAFKRLLEIAVTLFNYREYLIAAVTQNIAELKAMKQNEYSDNLKNASPIYETGAVEKPQGLDEVQEVKVPDLNNVVELKLVNDEEKNAT